MANRRSDLLPFYPGTFDELDLVFEFINKYRQIIPQHLGLFTMFEHYGSVKVMS